MGGGEPWVYDPDKPGVPAPQIFRPFAFQYDVYRSFSRVPRYLFRVYSPKTAGHTSTSNVTAPAWESSKKDNKGIEEKKKDLFDRSSVKVVKLLYEHIWWSKGRLGDHEEECNLMSWTSSLLFALQGGLHRYHSDKPRPKMAEIFVLVIDTHGFPKGTFLRDLEALDAFKAYTPDMNESIRRRSEGDSYFGEFFTQGDLNIEGRCSQASMQELANLGLFNLSPKMKNKKSWRGWQNSVAAYRSIYREPALATESTEVKKAVKMARRCFGEAWALPIATMLLSLKPRGDDDLTLVEGLRAEFSGEFQPADFVYMMVY